jgi:hypothetical protein
MFKSYSSSQSTVIRGAWFFGFLWTFTPFFFFGHHERNTDGCTATKWQLRFCSAMPSGRLACRKKAAVPLRLVLSLKYGTPSDIPTNAKSRRPCMTGLLVIFSAQPRDALSDPGAASAVSLLRCGTRSTCLKVSRTKWRTGK